MLLVLCSPHCILCCVCVHFSHVMNELLETERAYVEELLCVLEVSGVGNHTVT